MARLRMTNADYLAIAVSPALIMALVGSLVFFLIEVLYVGSYEIRLNYVFALFVFATVLIARIAIEFGSERAAMFSLPLGILVYIALMRFVQHPGPFSWLINLGLLAVVWWCAHKLTWDCTLIDDNEDASGEGLLGRVGLDDRDESAAPGSAVGAASNRKNSGPVVSHPRAAPGAARTTLSGSAPPDNELFAERDASEGVKRSWWKQLIAGQGGPHTPGIWVLYFSLAALPLFGVGQHWIPAPDVGRRRYAFGLLAVYVAAALSLLVTTSFLGLRRYLRQRHVEMPAPMAATWVSLGVVLILLVMFTAALIPRPDAEYAISRAPWQAATPGDLEASGYSVGDEGTDDPAATNRVTSGEQQGRGSQDADGTQHLTVAGEEAEDKAQQDSRQEGSAALERNGDSATASGSGKQGSSASEQDNGDATGGGEAGQGDEPISGETSDSVDTDPSGAANEQASGDPAGGQGQGNKEGGRGDDADEEGSAMRRMFDHAETPPLEILQSLSTSLANIAKLLFYAIIAGVIFYFAWTRRHAITQAIADIIRQLREFWARLLGGSGMTSEGESSIEPAAIRRRSFSEFTDPFTTGQHRRMPPVEIVRYTFEAFEAWAGDRGRRRRADQTPMELVRQSLPSQSPMYTQARQLVQLYNEAAYSAGTVSREAADSLQGLWQMMRTSAVAPREQAG